MSDFPDNFPNKSVFSEIEPVSTPVWRRTPTRMAAAVSKPTEKLFDDLDEYMAERYDLQEMPTFCDLAGASGFDSLTQMINHARRSGPETMRGISRALLAVSAGYEEEVVKGNVGVLKLLQQVPMLDSREPAHQAPQRPFAPSHDVNVRITGVSAPETEGRQLTGQQAYLKLIRHKTYEDLETVADSMEDAEDADYKVIELE